MCVNNIGSYTCDCVVGYTNCYANAKCVGGTCLCNKSWHYWVENQGCLTSEKPLITLSS